MKKILFVLILFSVSCNNQNASKKKLSSKVENPISNEIEIKLSSTDNMLFDKNIIYVNSRQKVTLTLEHTGKMDKKIMGHNFVLLKKDVDVVSFATRAMVARDSEYIPEGNETIAYTKLIGGGESDTIVFEAPEKGSYTYICSFPGHYGVMKGILIVK
tara:strand:- start:1841 stop:2314 length:474 start_codon:yes stop_codon:yes gene_type:complete